MGVPESRERAVEVSVGSRRLPASVPPVGGAGQVLSDEDEAEVYAAASYLASLTMGVLGELFQEAR